MATENTPGDASQVITRTKSEQRVARPRLYKVLFHNDDYTPMEFVVILLKQIFHHNDSDATRIMLHVHNNGLGVAGVFTRAVAETKVAEVAAAAETSEFPLLCTMEPAEDGDDAGGDDV